MVTITLRDVPDDIVDNLRASAKRNRRSVSQEAVVRLISRLELELGMSIEEFVRLRGLREAISDDTEVYPRASDVK